MYKQKLNKLFTFECIRKNSNNEHNSKGKLKANKTIGFSTLLMSLIQSRHYFNSEKSFCAFESMSECCFGKLYIPKQRFREKLFPKLARKT